MTFIQDLVTLLDYAQPSEEADFARHIAGGNPSEGHIIHPIWRLRDDTAARVRAALRG